MTGATIGENTTTAGSKEREMNRGRPMGLAGWRPVTPRINGWPAPGASAELRKCVDDTDWIG